MHPISVRGINPRAPPIDRSVKARAVHFAQQVQRCHFENRGNHQPAKALGVSIVQVRTQQFAFARNHGGGKQGWLDRIKTRHVTD